MSSLHEKAEIIRRQKEAEYTRESAEDEKRRQRVGKETDFHEKLFNESLLPIMTDAMEVYLGGKSVYITEPKGPELFEDICGAKS